MGVQVGVELEKGRSGLVEPVDLPVQIAEGR